MMLPRQKDMSSRAFIVTCVLSVSGQADINGSANIANLLGMPSIVGSNPAVQQRQGRANSVGEVVTLRSQESAHCHHRILNT